MLWEEQLDSVPQHSIDADWRAYSNARNELLTAALSILIQLDNC